MAELNATPPNLPLAPDEYERRYQDQLNNILRLRVLGIKPKYYKTNEYVIISVDNV